MRLLRKVQFFSLLLKLPLLRYRSRARYYPAGRSASNRVVPALELSTDLRRSHTKPAVLLTGGGDLLSAQVLLSLSSHLLSHSDGGRDDEAAGVLDGLSVHVVPSPDMDSLLGVRPGGDNCSHSSLSPPSLSLLEELVEQRGFVLAVQLRGGQGEGVAVAKGAAVDKDKSVILLESH